ncbi:hypothetical protein CsSME_00032071 [Camellia sinensis var. sinensis]
MGLSTKQVSGDGFDWGQSLLQSDNSLELVPKPPPPPPPATAARRQPPQQPPPEPLPCPRCGSSNTKFCYYNNYNKSQPRHFCKACKRHWTKGGTLRNVPVGGGRKNKRLKTATATATATASGTTTTSRSNNSHMGIHQKNISEFLYQGLTHEYSMNDDFLSSFESNPSSISASFRCSDAYDYTGGLDFAITTATTSAPATSSGSQPWQVVPTTTRGGGDGGVMDTSNYWNWDDFESLVSSTEINIPWEDGDTKIKP